MALVNNITDIELTPLQRAEQDTSSTKSISPPVCAGISLEGKDLEALEVTCRKRLNERIATQAGQFSLNEEEIKNVRDYDSRFIKDISLSKDDNDELRLLASWTKFKLKPPSSISSHRKIIGPLIVLLKRLTFPLVNFHMKDMVREMEEFASAVVERQAKTASELEHLKKTN